MADEDQSSKTEQPTSRRLEDAAKQGNIARSSEVQTVFVLLSALLALCFTGKEIWWHLSLTMSSILGHLSDIPFSTDQLQAYTVKSALTVAQCAGPIVMASMLGGILAGLLQNRFHTASEALTPNWNRLNPVSGLKNLFSTKSTVTTTLAAFKLSLLIVLSYSTVKDIASDPIFSTPVDVARIAEFMADSTLKILLRIIMILAVIAAGDYGYQFWRIRRDLMMTKHEVKEESKSAEGNPQIKSKQQKMRFTMAFGKMLSQVPKADVVITNPTHLAIALRYDPKTMKAPKVLAKGARLNALRIREMAKKHGVPIVENKPLARMIFKYAKVNGEVPAQLYVAIAELLAWVYRTNRYRYYTQSNQANATG